MFRFVSLVPAMLQFEHLEVPRIQDQSQHAGRQTHKLLLMRKYSFSFREGECSGAIVRVQAKDGAYFRLGGRSTTLTAA